MSNADMKEAPRRRQLEHISSLTKKATEAGLEKVIAEYFDASGEIGLAGTVNGVSHAIRWKLPKGPDETADDVAISALVDWFKARTSYMEASR